MRVSIRKRSLGGALPLAAIGEFVVFEAGIFTGFKNEREDGYQDLNGEED